MSPQKKRGRSLPQPKCHPDPLYFESKLYAQGFDQIAGVDEVGRGALAGPVFAAAVVLPPGLVIPGVKDSKKLSPGQREMVYSLITAQTDMWSVASVDQEEIDKINIHRASLKAMAQAIANLKKSPGFVLIDGRFPLGGPVPQQAIIKGDSLSHTIAAASIIAKVTRDRWMCEEGKKYPNFLFEAHKGYGTKRHIAAIERYGLTPLHRRSFTIKTWP